MSYATLSRMIENMIRLGKVEEIDLAGKCCRVRSGELLTNWLPWITQRAGTTRTWTPPTIGEQVLLLSPSGELGAGVVLTGLFSTAHPAPSVSVDEHVTEYPDGARISYNHVTGALEASGIKTALVQAATQVTIDCPTVTMTGNLNVAGDVTASGISLINHQHGGVTAGGDTTGAPQ